MPEYVIVKLECHAVEAAWGPFPTQDAAADWLGAEDDRLRDLDWVKQGEAWSVRAEEVDMEDIRYHILPLPAPGTA